MAGNLNTRLSSRQTGANRPSAAGQTDEDFPDVNSSGDIPTYNCTTLTQTPAAAPKPRIRPINVSVKF